MGYSMFRIFIMLIVVPVQMETLAFILPSTTTTSIPVSSLPSSYHEMNLRINNSVRLDAFWDQVGISSESTELGNKGNGTRNKIPFVIDRVEGVTNEDREQISSLIIKVFFEEEAERKKPSLSISEGIDRSSRNITPWKAVQLLYLKNLQNGDMKRKRLNLGFDKSDMFVARRITPSTFKSDDVEQVDISEVYNAKSLQAGSGSFIRGDIIGFVDITEKKFGLASEYDLIDGDDNDVNIDQNDKEELVVASGESTPLRKKSTSSMSLRPVLTNLAVSEECRGSSVGSKLVDACEDAVLNLWGEDYDQDEVILEVEGENEYAQRFYEKRGYKALFADPSTRRYDASGFFLKEIATTKICYRKDLRMKKAQQNGRKKMDLNDYFSSNIFQMVRNAVDGLGG